MLLRNPKTKTKQYNIILFILIVLSSISSSTRAKQSTETAAGERKRWIKEINISRNKNKSIQLKRHPANFLPL